MTLLQQLVYQVATDSGSRSQFQTGVLNAALSQEEQEALLSLRHLLGLSPEELLQSLTNRNLLGWIWPDN
ncbi:MAG: hypothetical protein L0332_03095 [Chloroflexi bacterium]|nr:hypothetical protein [Chloroflexota bacterium]MCI0645841.1 hypothetical protein [Chloroflexota bacterium]MCI0725696.1 hypothetical protein [Chloroflexota bacterium]